MKFSIRRKGTAAKAKAAHADAGGAATQQPVTMLQKKNHPNARPASMHTLPHQRSQDGGDSNAGADTNSGAHRAPHGYASTPVRPARRASTVVFECGAEHTGTCVSRQTYGTMIEAEADVASIAEDAEAQLAEAQAKDGASGKKKKPARILVSGGAFTVEYPSREQARHPLGSIIAAERDVITTPPSSILQLVYSARLPHRAGTGVVCTRFNVFTKDLPHICKLVQPETSAVNDRVFARRSTRKVSNVAADQRTAC